MPVTTRPYAQAKALLDAALEQEIGVAIKPSDQEGARNLFYEVRKGKPEYAGLVIFAPNNGEVFICKKEVELD